MVAFDLLRGFLVGVVFTPPSGHQLPGFGGSIGLLHAHLLGPVVHGFAHLLDFETLLRFET